MILEIYHGSNIIVEKPVIMPYFRTLDFGNGFYATTIYKQAEEWANKKSERRGGQAVINKYELAFEDLCVKNFTEINDEWADFVILHRQSETIVKHSFDVIIGEVADDRVYDSLQFYLDGVITKEQFIERIKFKEENNQLCLATNAALNKLKFRGAEYI